MAETVRRISDGAVDAVVGRATAPGCYDSAVERVGHFGRITGLCVVLFFFSSRRRHTRFDCDWSSDVCSSDLPWQVSTDRFGSWTTLRAALLRLVQGAMSAALQPSFDLAPYEHTPPELQQRARQLGSLVETVAPGSIGLSEFRGQLKTFFSTYAAERSDHGYPVWHPL